MGFLFMKDNDVLYIKKIIEYCDIADSLLDEYERDYLVFQSSKSFQLSTSMCIVQIGNMFQDCLMNLKNNMMRFLGEKSKA